MTNSASNRIGLVGLVAIASAMTPTVAGATEGGGTSKVLGVDTVLAGVMPDPGLQLTTFLGHYNATETKDGAGNRRSGISDFDLSIYALTARLQYVWRDTKLWGADIETRLGFTFYADGNVAFDVATPFGIAHRSGSAQGIGDALIAPVMLGWHSDTYHQIAGLEFFLPTGRFDPAKLANNGRGYYAAAPAYWFTWYPTKAVEVSGNLVYLYNFENPDTKYKSGRELSFDYGLGYAVTPTWQAGVSGYLYRQLTDDRVNGNIVGDGNRGKIAAMGPFVRYHPGRDWGLTFKWQIEGDATNKTQGNRFFFQFAYRLD